VEIPGQYLQMLAGRIPLTSTFIDSTMLKCEHPHQEMKYEGGMKKESQYQ